MPPSPVEGSGNPSPRSASPTIEEAQEAFSPNDDDDDRIAGRRKSSIWKKALNIRKRMSKVNQAFADGAPARFGATEGTRLPPIEVSPQSVDPNQYGSLPVMSSTELEHVEKMMILQNIADLTVDSSEECGGGSAGTGASGTDDDTALAADRRASVEPVVAEWKRRTAARRSDAAAVAAEDLFNKTLAASGVDGAARQSRPSDLPLFNENNGRPMPIPRSQSNRNQRLLSVPNIQYTRSISENVRSKTRKEPISIAANLMRRFSKYPICG